jgi:hypothetical protein
MIRSVMYFADDPESVAIWWAETIGSAPRNEGEFWFTEFDGVEIGLHPADVERNPVGGSPVS